MCTPDWPVTAYSNRFSSETKTAAVWNPLGFVSENNPLNCPKSSPLLLVAVQGAGRRVVLLLALHKALVLVLGLVLVLLLALLLLVVVVLLVVLLYVDGDFVVILNIFVLFFKHFLEFCKLFLWVSLFCFWSSTGMYKILCITCINNSEVPICLIIFAIKIFHKLIILDFRFRIPKSFLC